MNDTYHNCSDQSIQSDVDLCVLEDHRLFYLYHSSGSSYWEPPLIAWSCQLGLPYCWEEAVDIYGDVYFIDHLNRKATFNDPGRIQSLASSSLARSGNPPSQWLHDNWQLTEADANCEFSSTARDKTPTRLAANEPARSGRGWRVRFRDEVVVPSSADNKGGHTTGDEVAIPNTVKVNMENGQTKTFKYTECTTVKEILALLVEKLQIDCPHRFGLFAESSPGARFQKLRMLRHEQLISKLFTRPTLSDYPSCSRVYLRLRLVFVPLNIHEFAAEHPPAFGYLFDQCVNDVVSGRFTFDMRYEACLRLAVLHMRLLSRCTNPHSTPSVLNSRRQQPLDIKRIEDAYGLSTFLPTLFLQNVKLKELRKHLRFFAKLDQHQFDNGKAAAEERPKLSLNGVDSLKESLRHRKRRANKRRSNSCTPQLWRRKNASAARHSSSGSDGEASEVGHSPARSNGVATNATNQRENVVSATDDELKLRMKYVLIASNLPNFGGRSFHVTYKQNFLDVMVEIDPRYGLVLNGVQTKKGAFVTTDAAVIIGFHFVSCLYVGVETEVLRTVGVEILENSTQRRLDFVLDKEDLEPFVLYIAGYCEVSCNRRIPIFHAMAVDDVNSNCEHQIPVGTSPPPYNAVHLVRAAGWNYTPEVHIGSLAVLDLEGDGRPLRYEQAIRTSATGDEEEADNDGGSLCRRDRGQQPLENRLSSSFRELVVTVPVTDSRKMSSQSSRLSPLPTLIANSVSSLFFPNRIQTRVSNSTPTALTPNVLAHAKPLRARDSIRLHRQRHSIPDGREPAGKGFLEQTASLMHQHSRRTSRASGSNSPFRSLNQNQLAGERSGRAAMSPRLRLRSIPTLELEVDVTRRRSSRGACDTVSTSAIITVPPRSTANLAPSATSNAPELTADMRNSRQLAGRRSNFTARVLDATLRPSFVSSVPPSHSASIDCLNSMDGNVHGEQAEGEEGYKMGALMTSKSNPAIDVLPTMLAKSKAGGGGGGYTTSNLAIPLHTTSHPPIWARPHIKNNEPAASLPLSTATLRPQMAYDDEKRVGERRQCPPLGHAHHSPIHLHSSSSSSSEGNFPESSAAVRAGNESVLQKARGRCPPRLVQLLHIASRRGAKNKAPAFDSSEIRKWRGAAAKSQLNNSTEHRSPPNFRPNEQGLDSTGRIGDPSSDHVNPPTPSQQQQGLPTPLRNSDAGKATDDRATARLASLILIEQSSSPLAKQTDQPAVRCSAEEENKRRRARSRTAWLHFNGSRNLLSRGFKSRSRSGDLPPLPLHSATAAAAHEEKSDHLSHKHRGRPHTHLPETRIGHRRLPTSLSFPMSTSEIEEEFGDDFCPRSYSSAHPDDASPAGAKEAKPEIRRMSLRDFSGLEDPSRAARGSHPPRLSQYKSSFDYAPFLDRLHNGGGYVGSLLDKFSNRRRSSGSAAAANKNGGGGSPSKGADIFYDSFDRVVSDINSAIKDIALHSPQDDGGKTACGTEGMSDALLVDGDSERFKEVQQRLAATRARLRSTMDSVPNSSPKRVSNTNDDKLEMLNACKELVTTCKSLMRTAYNAVESGEIPLREVQNSVDQADQTSLCAERLISIKSSSLFQSQSITAKMDQVLKALDEVVNDVKGISGGPPKSSEHVRRLARNSTPLAAALTQLVQTTQNL